MRRARFGTVVDRRTICLTVKPNMSSQTPSRAVGRVEVPLPHAKNCQEEQPAAIKHWCLEIASERKDPFLKATPALERGIITVRCLRSSGNRGLTVIKETANGTSTPSWDWNLRLASIRAKHHHATPRNVP